MGIKKIRTLGLKEAMLEMEVGETCIAPDECSKYYVRRMCSELKNEGFLFTTRIVDEDQHITRLL